MTRPLKVLQSTGFSVATVLSRLILGVTIMSIAVLGFVLLMIPAMAAFVAMEWARARRWFARG